MIHGELTGDVTSVASHEGIVTIVEGRSFCRSTPNGDVEPSLAQGLFVLDMRALSRWELRVNGHPVEVLTVEAPDPYSARFVGRAHPHPGHGDSDLLVFRERFVGRGMTERISVVSYGLTPIPVTIELLCDTDFADIFEVKNGRIHTTRRQRTYRTASGALVFAAEDDDGVKEVCIAVTGGAIVEPGTLTWRRPLEPRETWTVGAEVSVSFEGERLVPRFPLGFNEEATVPSRRMASWRARLPDIQSASPQLDAVIARSAEDLGSLRIFDPEHPDVPILAAGAPWYMTVFGRDSLLTGWMTLIADRSLAGGVLDTLARFQGDDGDARTEEEPGKILHEIRLDLGDGMTLREGDVYYGSIDATPLFVMLLAEARRWGLDDDGLRRLLPHADRAIEWIEHFGDRDGDGYVEYQRSTADGLANQGWKDSWDGVRFADGAFPQPPIALCEVQGYVYAAYLARAELAGDVGDVATRDRCLARAAELRRRFNEDFWLEAQGTYALALDADKRPVDAVTSNPGHCLWTGIAEPERAARVADRLLQPDLFSGWGVRTLAASMAAYNPVSYHNGSVWPHDCAIVADGLARYGFVDHAHRIITGQLDVALHHDGRLPELFAGLSRDELATPAAYPSSCSPQAWAAAAPLLWLRTLLRLEPAVHRGRLAVSPALPEWLPSLHVEGIAIGDHSVSVHVEDGTIEVSGAGGLEVVGALQSTP